MLFTINKIWYELLVHLPPSHYALQIFIKDDTSLRGNIVYADIGPASFNQSQPLASASTLHLDLDEHRVEYAQLNHKAHIPKPALSFTNDSEGTLWLIIIRNFVKERRGTSSKQLNVRRHVLFTIIMWC